MTSKTVSAHKNYPLSVAPMMDWTDRHCRYFHRLLSPGALLYTEMVTTGAIIHGDADRFLRFNEEEHPVALQLGGSDPKDLAFAARAGEIKSYDEINLNCGCPSDRVQSGCFGAVLMRSPELVAECVKAMRDAVSIPVTVKCRIAIDEEEEDPFLRRFLECVCEAGCQKFIIHARKAWLKGLNPKENRDIPPLNYKLVAQMKQEFPHIEIHLNGGLRDIPDIQEALTKFNGAMIGRAAYQNPRILQKLEEAQTPHYSPIPDIDIIDAMAKYATREYNTYGTPVKTVAKHMIGMFQGQAGARLWRQSLSPLIPEKFGLNDPGDGTVLLKIYDHVFNNTGRLSA